MEAFTGAMSCVTHVVNIVQKEGRMTRKLNLLKKTEAAARRNHIVVSDIHAASKLGLCHPDGHELDEGGIYSPSRVQQKMWRWWDEF